MIMGNKYLDTKFVDEAIKFAVDAHANTERRGKGFPYVIHVLEAMEIVASITNDKELLAAAVLHDTVEDTDVTVEEIRSRFGDRVASIVAAESDQFETGVSEEDSWKGRKQAAIDRLAAASLDAKTVALGDKLSNMRAIARDYRQQGDKLWDLFHAPGGKKDHEWHYRGLAASLKELEGTDAYDEFCCAIEKVFGHTEPELIDMADYEESGDGFTAISYNHKDGDRMIKLYAGFIPEAVPRRELTVASAVARMGLPTPAALRMVTEGTRIGVEFERVKNKKSYARLISQEPEKTEEYAREFARFCRKLSETKCDTTVFKPARMRFQRAIAEIKGFSDAQKAKMYEFIDSIPLQDTCTHGDMHIGNVLVADGKQFWIDLSDFGYDDPRFDLGMFYMTSYGIDDDTLSDKLFHMSSVQQCRVWDYFADEYFDHRYTREEIHEMIAPFAALYMVHFLNIGIKDHPCMIPFIEKHLINR